MENKNVGLKGGGGTFIALPPPPNQKSVNSIAPPPPPASYASVKGGASVVFKSTPSISIRF